MKISLITVAYNSAQTIGFAIDSVLSQSYPDIEYIIIDGSSTDNTVMIARSYGNRIAQLVSEPDKGIYDAMNKGISLATGEVIGILNSDDLYADETVISDVMSHFTKDPTLDMLYGDLVYVKKEDVTKVVRRWVSKDYYASFFEDGHVPPHPALFLRSRVYRAAGMFDRQYRLAADYEFMLRIFKKHSFTSLHLPRLMIKMRLGGATNNSYKNIINGNKEILTAWKNNGLRIPFRLMPLRIIKRLRQFFQKPKNSRVNTINVNILLTGNSGFLGRYVSDELSAAGHTIVRIGRRTGDAAILCDLSKQVPTLPGILFDKVILPSPSQIL